MALSTFAARMVKQQPAATLARNICYTILMQLDINSLIRIAVLIVVGGIILFALTFLVDLLLPLLVIAVFIVIAFLVFRFFKTGTIGF